METNSNITIYYKSIFCSYDYFILYNNSNSVKKNNTGRRMVQNNKFKRTHIVDINSSSLK